MSELRNIAKTKARVPSGQKCFRCGHHLYVEEIYLTLITSTGPKTFCSEACVENWDEWRRHQVYDPDKGKVVQKVS